MYQSVLEFPLLIKRHDQKQLGDKWVPISSNCLWLKKGGAITQLRNLEELKQRPWSIQLTGLLSQLSYTNQDHLLRGCTAPQWVETTYINHQTRKCTADLWTGKSYGDIFSTESHPFPNDFSLCQVDIKLAITGHTAPSEARNVHQICELPGGCWELNPGPKKNRYSTLHPTSKF